MKYLMITLMAVFTFSFVNAQEKSDSKISEISFQVDGVCKMCKERIEDAALRTPGVKLAEWNKNTKDLRVIYKNTKTTEEEIQQSVANRGHTTEKLEADSTAYEALPDCCKYKDGVETH
jgi:cation transport ATPase